MNRWIACAWFAVLAGSAPARAQPALQPQLVPKVIGVGTWAVASQRDAVSSPIGDLPDLVPRIGHGSGVTVTSDGLIVTNHHVIDGYAILVVGLPGSRRLLAAKPVYADPA